jgi:hypothetical protein
MRNSGKNITKSSMKSSLRNSPTVVKDINIKFDEFNEIV